MPANLVYRPDRGRFFIFSPLHCQDTFRHTGTMQRNPDITYFGVTNFRNKRNPFGIWQHDRLQHMYVIGKTGTGKSTLLETMIQQDIEQGRGLCLIDPHGDLVERVYASLSVGQRANTIYFNLPDAELALRYNPLKRVRVEKRSLVASSIMEVFSKLWDSNAWGVKLEHILRNTILALLDQPSATFADIQAMLLDKEYRKDAIYHIKNPSVRLFWQKEFPQYQRYDLLPVLNKIGGMLSHPVIRRVLVENPTEVSLRKAMDEKKIILVNLAKGHLGEDVAHLFGSLIVTALGSAAMSRADTREDDRVPFVVYLDEFQNFTTASLVGMLSELRKFKIGFVLAHQYLYQLDDDIRRSVLGNVGTLISFRVGLEDARTLAKEMHPVFEDDDFVNLPNYNMYVKLLIDGKPSRAFSSIIN